MIVKGERVPKLRFPGFKGAWQVKKRGDILDYEQPAKYIVDSVEYDNSYNVPVLTAGKTFILGYTNEKNGVFNNGLPVILFDDFTTASQWVDFPFKIKSSAAKILKAKNGVNLRIAYEILKSISIDAEDHQRYWIGTYQNLDVFIPDYPEQKKISAFLAVIEERLICIKKRALLLEQYKKSAIQKIFTQQIRFNGFSDKWEKRAIDDIAYSETSPLSANQIECQSGQYKVYGASGVLQTLDRYHYEDEYIAIVKDGAGAGRISFCEPKSSVLGTLIVVQPKQHINKRFLYYLLSLIDFKKYTTGSTIPHVYFKQYSKEEFLIPSNQEQQEIADFLTALDDMIEQDSKKLQKTEQFKKYLLQKLLV